jgi:hypothetical protein
MPVLVLLAQVLEESTAALLQGGMVRRLLLRLGVLLPVDVVVQRGSTVQQEGLQEQGVVGTEAHLLLLLEPGVRVGMLARMGAGLLLLLVLQLALELVVLWGGLRILQRVSTALCHLRLLLDHKHGSVSGWGFGRGGG